MNRLVPVIFVILLVSGMGIFSIYEYSRNQQLAAENTQLKNRLSKQALQLSLQELRLSDQGWQLSQTEARVVELEKRLNNTIETLEKQIAELKHNYTYVRLALFVNTQYLTKTELSNPVYLRTLLHEINDVIWEPLKVKFLITVVSSDEYATTVGACNSDSHARVDSNRLFGYHHFTAFVVDSTGPWAGCIPNDQGPREDTMVLDGIIFRNFCGPSGACGAQYAAEVITHEFLHLMGYSDKALHVGIKFEGTKMVIPLSWYRQILGRISWFTINVG